MGKNKNIYLVLIIGVILAALLRIYFLLKPGYSYDINCFLNWGGQIKTSGFWSLFSGDYYLNNNIDYPPLIPLISSWWFALVGHQDVFYFKILPTIFEIGLIVVNVFFILKKNFKHKGILLLVVILQPALAFVSSAWGQVDAIMSLFIISGFLFFEKNFYLSTTFLFLAFLAKPQAAIAIFVYLIALVFRKNKGDFFRQAGTFLVLFALAIAVFKIFGSSSFLDPYTRSVGRYTNLSLNAFNLWWLVFGEKAWSLHDTIGPYKMIGLALFTLFEAPVFLYCSRRKVTFVELFILASYSYLAFFVFPTQIHERYMFPAIALLAIPAAEYLGIFYIYIILSITFLYNCFAVLESVYPQFSSHLGNLLVGNIPVIISFVNVISVLYFAYFILDEAFKNKR